MYLGRTVIDAERPDFLVDAHHHCIGGDAKPTQHLKGPVCDATQSLGTKNLALAGFDVRLVALIEQPRGMPNGKTANMQIYLVVGEHETDTFMLAYGLAEGTPVAGVGYGDIMRAASGAEPSHAMGQARRRETYLSITEPFTDLAQHLPLRHAYVDEIDHCMATR